MNSERPCTLSRTDFNNTDIHDSGSDSAQLAEWIEKMKQEEMTTPGSTHADGIVSDVISDDLLGIWFNTTDSAAQKVSIHTIVIYAGSYPCRPCSSSCRDSTTLIIVHV